MLLSTYSDDEEVSRARPPALRVVSQTHQTRTHTLHGCFRNVLVFKPGLPATQRRTSGGSYRMYRRRARPVSDPSGLHPPSWRTRFRHKRVCRLTVHARQRAAVPGFSVPFASSMCTRALGHCYSNQGNARARLRSTPPPIRVRCCSHMRMQTAERVLNPKYRRFEFE